MFNAIGDIYTVLWTIPMYVHIHLANVCLYSRVVWACYVYCTYVPLS